ncbi:MAG: 4Fe-4S binding protein [Clostridia bacterium]|nr:4Fe-4S binding protein [Clostridia bacterium]
MTAKKELILNPDWCKGCGICAAFCPKGALEIVNDKVRRVADAECTLCGQCELRCPDYAIYINEDEPEGDANQWIKSY